MTGYIRTIKDLEAATYGMGNMQGNALLKSAGIVGGFGTPHDQTSNPFTPHDATSATALYGVIYGQKVWSMLNQEVNALSMLAKRPYTSSGWRVMTARASGGSTAQFITTAAGNAEGNATPDSDELGGRPENEALANIAAIAPTYDRLYMSPKTIAHKFEFSELGMELAKIDDGVGDIRAIVREDMGKHHAEVQNKMLLVPLEHYDDTNTHNTLIERNYTSLNKVVTNNAELEAMRAGGLVNIGGANQALNHGGGATAATLTNLYGNSSRQTGASFMDSIVDLGAGYGATQHRNLTLSLLNSMIQNIRLAGGGTKVILTGYDTIQALADLLQSQERFLERKEILPSHNGVKGVKGREVGFRVATYFDLPLIPCKDMQSTANLSLTDSVLLSDLLFLDTDHLWLSVMKPTQYFEDGITSGNPFGVGKLGNQGLYRTIGEVGCSFFKSQGKITNLK